MQSYKEGEKWNDNNGQDVMGICIKFYLLVSTLMISDFLIKKIIPGISLKNGISKQRQLYFKVK